MRRPIKTRKDLDIASNHFLRRNPGYPLGVTLTELDYLRGSNDDFFGDAIDAKYSTTFAGAGTITPQNNMHGGVIKLLTGALVNDYSALRLAQNYNTLQAQTGSGWIMLVRAKVNETTNRTYRFGAGDFGVWNNYITPTVDTALANPNWYLRTRTGGGALNDVDSGVAADTNWHWHALEVRQDYAAHYLDGDRINQTVIAIPNAAFIEAFMYTLTTTTVAKSTYVDVWDVIPRNL